MSVYDVSPRGTKIVQKNPELITIPGSILKFIDLSLAHRHSSLK